MCGHSRLRTAHKAGGFVDGAISDAGTFDVPFTATPVARSRLRSANADQRLSPGSIGRAHGHGVPHPDSEPRSQLPAQRSQAQRSPCAARDSAIRARQLRRSRLRQHLRTEAQRLVCPRHPTTGAHRRRMHPRPTGRSDRTRHRHPSEGSINYHGFDSRRPVRGIRQHALLDQAPPGSRRGVGFELDNAVFETSRRNLSIVSLDITLLHQDHEAGLAAMSIPEDQLLSSSSPRRGPTP